MICPFNSLLFLLSSLLKTKSYLHDYIYEPNYFSSFIPILKSTYTLQNAWRYLYIHSHHLIYKLLTNHNQPSERVKITDCNLKWVKYIGKMVKSNKVSLSTDTFLWLRCNEHPKIIFWCIFNTLKYFLV